MRSARDAMRPRHRHGLIHHLSRHPWREHDLARERIAHSLGEMKGLHVLEQEARCPRRKAAQGLAILVACGQDTHAHSRPAPRYLARGVDIVHSGHGTWRKAATQLVSIATVFGTLFYTLQFPNGTAVEAVVAVAMSDGEGRTGPSFAAMSAGSTTIDMLTWVPVMEIVHSTHYSTLLVVATGRLAIHFGMASGEIAALLAHGSTTAFFVVSIVALMLVMGYCSPTRQRPSSSSRPWQARFRPWPPWRAKHRS